MADLICSKCSIEYNLERRRYMFRDDEGGSVSCHECGTTLYSWGAMACTFSLVRIRTAEEEKQEMINRPVFQVEVNKPILGPRCRCKEKMILKNGLYGKFWGCVNFPKGCRMIKKYKPKK
ncbi:MULTISPECIES: hypothetical protein [unclassified Leptospira]|uniref:hypothetical protein n=1 Tax=unclassified Leptospira TaxID=2633828 RepID=UPI000690C3A8|nr:MULTISPECIES: hypothetical protein [unclassified Leptospira]MCR1795452.1 hypothetical protein [Leptospira sp. id769339]